jgi:uncharacterized RDD family membrane protein YckC
MSTAVIECRRCGRRVSAEAPRCPECCADPRDGRSSFREEDRDCVRVCEGLWVRFLALAVDGLILSGIFLFIGLAVFQALVMQGRFGVKGEEPFPWYLWLAFSVAAFVYFLVCEAQWSQTLGKRLFGLRVVRSDGGRVGYGAAFARTALRIIDFLPFAYLAAAIAVTLTPRKQRLGDLAAGTVVVRPRTVRLSEPATSALPTVPWVGPEAAALDA